MKAFILVAALIVFISNLKGQKNLQKAILLTNSGDSIKGFINYQNWKNNPKTIDFIDDQKQSQKFDPASIKGFIIPSAGETYASFDVETNTLPQDEREAIDNENNPQPPVKNPVFLLQLVKHPLISLYVLVRNRKPHFYFSRSSEEPKELIHFFQYNESIKQVLEDDEYKKQLEVLFSSCANVVAEISSLHFDQDEIQAAFIKYIKCAAPGSAIEIKSKDKSSLKLGFIGGAMLNHYKLAGTDEVVDNNYGNNISPVIGISLDLGLSRNLNKWHLVNEIILKSYKTSSSFVRPYGNGYSVANDVKLGFLYTQLNTLLRYIYQSGGSVVPYINAGIGNAFSIKENQNSIKRTYSFGREENTEAINGPRKYEFSLQGGAGISTKNIQVELRYGWNKKGFSPYQNLDINPSSLQFLLTYQLK